MTPTALLQTLAGLQSEGNALYAPGLFPAQRFHRHLPYSREDDNIFFTASIAFILQRALPLMSEYEQAIANGIISKAIRNYPAYRNKAGIPTYNFFAIGEGRHFPNGRFLHRHQTFRPADDADDTALIHLTAPHSQEETLWLKEKLAAHANGSQKWMTHNLSKYRGLKAYSTFFGEKMYIDLDICVLCNVLYWVFENDLPLNVHDRDSSLYISSVIENGEHLNQHFQVGPSYPYPVHIIYHLARLLSRFEVPGLSHLKPRLLQDAQEIFSKKTDLVEKAMLGTSILRLGGKVTAFDLENADERTVLQAVDDFDLFYVNPLAFFSQPWNRKLDHWPLFHLRCRCPGLFVSYLMEFSLVQGSKPISEESSVRSSGSINK